MTKRVGDVVHIEEEAPAECEGCGKLAELRPYGANDERICFDCAMKDPATTQRQYAKLLEGVDHVTAPAADLARHRKT